MPELRRRPLLAALPGLALVSAPAGAQSPPLKLGTATPGGGFPVYGAAFDQGDQGRRSDLRDRGGEHQGQHRERAVARGRQARPRAGPGRGRRRTSSPAPAAPPSALKIVTRDVCLARHVRRAGRQPLSPHRRSQGQAGRLGRARLGSRHPGPLRRGRHRLRSREGFRAGLSRARGRRSGNGARRQGGGPVGWRRALAGLRRRRQPAGGARFLVPDAGEIDRILAKYRIPRSASRCRRARIAGQTARDADRRLLELRAGATRSRRQRWATGWRRR